MKKTIFEIMTDKWNKKATDEFCHIKIDDNIKNNYIKYLSEIDLENKVVIDYGCGGGHLGKYLFKEKKILKYYGFDICDKSIKSAEKNLKNYDATLIKVDKHIDFSIYNADIFISFECIQHFPTFQYLLSFLKTVNESKISEILLQIRTGKITFVNKNVMTFICKIPDNIIIDNLKNYTWLAKKRYFSKAINKEVIYFYSNDLLAINKAANECITRITGIEDIKKIGIKKVEDMTAKEQKIYNDYKNIEKETIDNDDNIDS